MVHSLLSFLLASQANYLDVTLGRTLTSNAHIKKKISQAKNCLCTCRYSWEIMVIESEDNNLDFHSCYQAGDILRNGRLVAKSQANHCEPTTRQCAGAGIRITILGITGAMVTITSTDDLNTLLDLPSLGLFIMGQARISAYRLKQTGYWRHLQRAPSSIGCMWERDG